MSQKHSVPEEVDVTIALGGNLPAHGETPEITLARAIEAIRLLGVRLTAISRFYVTPCFPVGAGPDYVNAVISGRYDKGAEALLTGLHKVEADFLRQRTQRWGARTLDLDLLSFADCVLPDLQVFMKWHDLLPHLQAESTPGELILPHPRMQDRAFVLVPMCDIAAGWVHPVLGRTAADLLTSVSTADAAEVLPL